MGIWKYLKNLILGCDVITTEDAKLALNTVIDIIDADKSGKISVGELIKMVKIVVKI